MHQNLDYNEKSLLKDMSHSNNHVSKHQRKMASLNAMNMKKFSVQTTQGYADQMSSIVLPPIGSHSKKSNVVVQGHLRSLRELEAHGGADGGSDGGNIET